MEPVLDHQPLQAPKTEAHNFTDVLYNSTVNRDPITDFPTENPNLRQRLLDQINTAVSEGKTIGLVDADMDYLKRLNDRLGKKKTDLAIRQVVEDKRTGLTQLSAAHSCNFAIYRPQAGGDEYKCIIFYDQEAEPEIRREITEIFSRETVFQTAGYADEHISSSFGFAAHAPGEEKDAGNILQTLEGKAEEELVGKKWDKIDAAVRATVKAGRGLSVQEYIELVIERWGAKRPGERTMRVILQHVVAKTLSTAAGLYGK